MGESIERFGVHTMMNVRVNQVSYEMLVELGKKNRPPQNPEKMMDLMIKQKYNSK